MRSQYEAKSIDGVSATQGHIGREKSTLSPTLKRKCLSFFDYRNINER